MVPASRHSRILRGLAAASFATLAALLSHTSGGGAVPGWLGLLVPWVLSIFACTALSGRRPTLWRLSLGIGLSQLLFHALFVLGATPTASSPLLSHHHVQTATAEMPPDAPMTGLLPGDPSMWLWHGVAALATISVFYRAERLVTRVRSLADQIVEWAGRRLSLVLPVVLPIRPVRLVAVPRPVRLRPAPQRCSVTRRGPPLQPVV